MRTDVRSLLDDKTNDTHSRWQDANVDSAIDVARAATADMLAKNGYNGLWSSTDVTLSGGTATIPAHRRILSVQIVTNTNFENITQGTHFASRTRTDISGTIRVTYIDKTSALSADGDTVTYANKDLDDLVVDQFCAAFAANLLKATEAENNQILVNQLSILEKSLIGNTAPVIKAAKSSHTFNRNIVPYRWAAEGTVLEIYT